ncbi:hypothetical protein SAMN04488061_2876 [Filomicrobium insigne]|uniref:Capsule polysaccharide biosynthesis protein n=1 Tax=Filomicrobium insigne TaxID=418854 RepID=A0A1H0SFI0_9HYPH|nr:hypothetical protein [Filomicrobium insigne]SDP40484.1 hypothetical protein SAMN04488061_2876 [Filomicrobium insigne]
MKSRAPLAVVVARKPHHGNPESFHQAFADGLQRHGWRVSLQRHPSACDLLVLWGVRNRPAIAQQNRARGDVCILERGYLGDRFKWTSVSFGGGLNGHAEFRGVRVDDPSRFETHFGHMLQPWRKSTSRRALLVGQVYGDMSLAGVNIDDWYRDTAKGLRARGWEVYFRPHPVALKKGQPGRVQGVPNFDGTLAEALAFADLVVTFNSNTGVEAVLSGCPLVAFNQGAMAWPVAGHSLDEIVTPDRTAWAHGLAWKQWTIDELRSGFCWDVVSHGALVCG